MSDIATGRQDDSARARAGALFSVRSLTLLLLLGLLGFVGMLVLGAYAPDLRSGRNGGAHALSNAATGYSAVIALARAVGGDPQILRDPKEFDAAHLLIVTPESGSVNISDALKGRDYRPTLFVLPKWSTEPDKSHSGWVRKTGMIPLFEPVGVLAPGYRFVMRRYGLVGKSLITDPALPTAIRLRAPPLVQVIARIEQDPKQMDDPEYRDAIALHPLITDDQGGIVLARLGTGPRYVLADPDLLNNIGMKDEPQAASALALLQWMNGGSLDDIAFDVSFNGFGRSRSPLKLLFEPPFAAMTLTILAALLLAGIHAFGRFGPVRRRERAIALGKTTLIDNSAALIRKAGREAGMGARYAAVIRDGAARAFGAPAHLRDGPLDTYLDALKGNHRFTKLAAEAADARDRHSLLAAAQALHAWKGDTIR
ncbi:MAG TPA: hypothetical protein VF503_07080 [Sphingobium sp.]|uniref:hypothetical protein n=1 Tax=Sphingobium sp. TaxID=1912891 RepID=UPI002ED65871